MVYVFRSVVREELSPNLDRYADSAIKALLADCRRKLNQANKNIGILNDISLVEINCKYIHGYVTYNQTQVLCFERK